jgi:anti-sigma B factor antagonist
MATVRIEDPLDMARSPGVRRTLLRELVGEQRMTIDLSAVTRIDSSGLASLVEVLQAARTQGKECVFVGIRHEVRCVFKLARLDKLFAIEQPAKE